MPRDSRLPGGVEARIEGRPAGQVEQLDVEVGLLIEGVRRVLQHRRDGQPHVDLSVGRVHVGEAYRHRLLEHVGVLVLPVRRRILVVEPRGTLSVEGKPERLPGAEIGVGLRQRRPADDIRRVDAGAEPGQVERREARRGRARGPAHAVCVQIVEQHPTRGRRRPDRVVFEIAVNEDEVRPGSRVERNRVFLRSASARREDAQREQRQDASTSGKRHQAVAHFSPCADGSPVTRHSRSRELKSTNENRANGGGGYVLLRTVCTPQCLSLDYAMQRATGLRRLRVVVRHEKPRPVQPEVVRVSRRLDGKGSRSRTVAASTPRATAARAKPWPP